MWTNILCASFGVFLLWPCDRFVRLKKREILTLLRQMKEMPRGGNQLLLLLAFEQFLGTRKTFSGCTFRCKCRSQTISRKFRNWLNFGRHRLAARNIELSDTVFREIACLQFLTAVNPKHLLNSFHLDGLRSCIRSPCLWIGCAYRSLSLGQPTQSVFLALLPFL